MRLIRLVGGTAVSALVPYEEPRAVLPTVRLEPADESTSGAAAHPLPARRRRLTTPLGDQARGELVDCYA